MNNYMPRGGDNVIDLGELARRPAEIPTMPCLLTGCDVELPLQFPTTTEGLQGMMSVQMHLMGHVIQILQSATKRVEEMKHEQPRSGRYPKS